MEVGGWEVSTAAPTSGGGVEAKAVRCKSSRIPQICSRPVGGDGSSRSGRSGRSSRSSGSSSGSRSSSRRVEVVVVVGKEPTFFSHAHLDALPQAAELALVAVVLVHRTVAVAATRVAQVAPHAALEEALATCQATTPKEKSKKIHILAHFIRQPLNQLFDIYIYRSSMTMFHLHIYIARVLISKLSR